jgi:hypothetical protein
MARCKSKATASVPGKGMLPAAVTLCLLTLIPWSQGGERQGASYTPCVTGRLDNLNVPVEPILRQLPGVVEVEVRRPTALARRRIVHLKDWHFVPKDLFAADIRKFSIAP